jgi:ribonuclease P protein component
MLPRAHRLRRSAEFGHVVRRGSRAGSSSVVVHALIRSDLEPVRVGFVVGRSVGNAVHRNAVKRRLRHLLAVRLDRLPDHSSVVVRANPAAATTDADQLGADLDGCLDSVVRRLTGRRTSRLTTQALTTQEWTRS